MLEIRLLLMPGGENVTRTYQVQATSVTATQITMGCTTRNKFARNADNVSEVPMVVTHIVVISLFA